MRARWHLRVNALVVLWLVAAAVVAGLHRQVPQSSWLMVHLLLLGGASTAILIWSAHFAEAVRRAPLPGGHRHQAWRLGLHTGGALTVIGGLLTGLWAATVAGATVVGLVALWHGGTLLRQGRGALGVRLGWTVWYFVAAALALPVGAALGAILARPDLAGDSAARAYVAHVTVMLLGWVGLTVTGTLATLWPTVLRVQVDDDALPAARAALALGGGGLVVALVGAGLGSTAVTGVGLLLHLAGALRATRPLVRAMRRRRPDSAAGWSLAAAWCWYLGSAAVWAGMVGLAPSWAVAQARFAGLIAPLAVGFAAQMLVGSLSHLGPMVLGGGPAAVRAARAVVERGGLARVLLVNAGLAVFLAPVPSLVRVGTSMLVLGALVAAPVLLVRAAFVSRRLRALPATGPRAVAAAELLHPAAVPRSGRGPALAAAAALALVVAGGVAADPAAVGLGRDASGGVTASGRTVEVTVEARDMRFFPDRIDVEAGDRLVLTVVNVDDTVHDLVLDSGASSGRLAPGAETELDLGVVGRSLDGWCSVAGHRQMGMVLQVVATGADGAVLAGGDDGSGQTPDDGPGMHPGGSGGSGGEGGGAGGDGSAASDMDLMAEPGPGFRTRDATLPAAASSTLHKVRLEVQEVEREVAPGVTQTVWTFGGTAPGPVLRGKVGDRFEITLVNDGSLGHSIDFHAGALAPDRPMRTIEPGEELVYTFTATRAGIWMYHCSTMPMSLHIANGMAGAVVIDPPDLPPVDKEYLLVQHELFLGPQGGTADESKVRGERPDAVVFNGHATQYDHDPLTARVGERVRFWVLDVGPNRPSAFHVVGGQFDTVYLEGAYQLGGADGPATDSGAQVLGLMPAQGGFVELTFPEPGHYPFVSHLMIDAERGAHGIVEVTR